MNDEASSGDNENTGSSVAEKPKIPTSRSSMFPVLVLACIAIAALVISILVFQKTRTYEENVQGLGVIQKQISLHENRLENLIRKNNELENSINETGNRLGLLEENLDSIYQNQKHEEIDWTLAEIEHLLIIATHELLLDADVNTALAALQSADARLRDITDPAVLEIRAQLTTDINSLKSVDTVDIPGMTLYMADIINRVEKLPLKKTSQAPMNSGNGENTDISVEQAPLWKKLFQTVWNELKNLVVITKEDEAGVLTLLPDQRYYLYQNLRLQLEAARLAILEHDTDNLRTSIEQILEWIEKYFDVEDAAIYNIITSLNQMSRVDLQPALPDISSSLETLRAFIRDRTAPQAGE